MGAAPWPLPELGIAPPPAPAVDRRRQFPLTEVLVRVAMAEGRSDEVLRWYDARQPSGADFYQVPALDDEVAEAVAQMRPDRAVAIWKRLAEGLIAQTLTRAYESALTYLRKVRRVLAAQGRADEWRAYVADLRAANARKRKLVELLDRMDRPVITDV